MNKGIFKDNKGRWYIHTSIKGKTCTIRGFNSKQEANDNYDIAIEKWKREHDIVGNSQFLNVLDDYLLYRSKLVRKESLRKDKAQFKYYSLLFSCDRLSNVFKEARLKIIYNDILTNDEFSSQKKMRLVLAFRDFSKYCYLSQLINQDTYNMVLMTFLPVKEDKHERKSKRYIPISHFKALSSVIIKDNDYLFNLAIFVLYSCGLRVSELLGLLGIDIDMNKKIVNVRRQLQTNGKITTTLKTSNSYRSVPMNDELFNLFKKFKLTDDRLFPYSHTGFKRRLINYEQEASIPNYSCHEFRESFCTNLAMKITNISEVSYCAKVSGHTTSMFLDTYVKSLDNELTKKFF